MALDDSSLYDYESAITAGQGPSSKEGPNKGHWSSRVASGPNEGLILKAQNHPTFGLAVKGEQEVGNKMYIAPNGRLYSFAPGTTIPPGFQELSYVNQPTTTSSPSALQLIINYLSGQ